MFSTLLDIMNDYTNYFYKKDGNDYILEILAAGYSKDELKIYTEGSYLHIESKNSSEETKSYFKKQIKYKFYVNDYIDKKSIKAIIEKGILTISLKVKESEKNYVDVE